MCAIPSPERRLLAVKGQCLLVAALLAATISSSNGQSTSGSGPLLGKRQDRLAVASELSVHSYREPPVSMPSATLAAQLDAREIFRSVAPSVYLVIAADTLEGLQSGSVSQGSAVAISNHLALTNCHIFEDNKKYIAIFDTGKVMPATLLDVDVKGDRCILESAHNLRPIQHARGPEGLEVGEVAYTIGNPAGLEASFAQGIISGVRVHEGQTLIQTTAAISGGSSGGALVDSWGNVLGITTFLLNDAQNLNFAISINEYWTTPTAGNGRLEQGSSVSRAIYYFQGSEGEAGQAVDGTASWAEITKDGRPSIQATIIIAKPDLRATLTISRNHDAALPASHLIEVRFEGGASNRIIQTIPALVLKSTEQARGKPLAGAAISVVGNQLFWIALSDNQDEVGQNLQLLRQGRWFDIPILFSDETRAVITFEKGELGNNIFETVMARW